MLWKNTSTILRRLGTSDDSSAWSALVGRFQVPIVHFAQRIGLPPEEAEDVAQETLIAFVTTFRNGRFDPSKGRLSTWLFGIAMREVLSARRRLAARQAHVRSGKSTSFWAAVPAAASDSAIWAREWERALFRKYLEQARLEVEPVTYRAFELVVWAGRKPDEAASELGIPIKAVYNAKHRVLKHVRELREDCEAVVLKEMACLAGTGKS